MKIALILSLLIASLFAESFEAFKLQAVQKSPFLKANKIVIESTRERASLNSRYKNPSLSLESSLFTSNAGNRDNGYRAALTQSIRLWGVGDAREKLSSAQVNQATSYFSLSQQTFVRKLSLLYVLYKKAHNLEELAQKEFEISQKIETISHERYKNGTIAKVKYIQAKLDMQRVNNRLTELKIKRQNIYYSLLALSGLEDYIQLDTDYEFPQVVQNKHRNSSQIAYLQSEKKSALASSELNSNKIEWIDLYVDYEQEPDQSIARVGVDIPLAIFNTKSQEKKIAQYKAQSLEYLVRNRTNAIEKQVLRLQKSLLLLKDLQQSTQELLASQEELLVMYEDGYKIANINLIELQLLKNQMIQTQEKLINIHAQKEQNIIEYTFLTGENNE